ncbi:MAG: 4Fe-4S dicluster domain-containing protein [Patescibacteria group bacterium]
MSKIDFAKFVDFIFDEGIVIGPTKQSSGVVVRNLQRSADIDLSGTLPENGFKSFILPKSEVLFDLEPISENKAKKNCLFLFGVSLLDLQALTLFEYVFEKDVYFQSRRREYFVIGFSAGIENDYRKYKVFHDQFEDNVLEHVLFDVFIEKQKNGNYRFFAGSEKGQKLLERAEVNDYENIEFVGITKESGPEQRIFLNKKLIAESVSHPLWIELGNKCLACGKCSVICPTCFCFDLRDVFDSNGKLQKTRQQSSCFFPHFTKVAGDNKELISAREKIYFWYYHKFVRIPEEFNYFGCVGCGRCSKVCPAGINIAKNLQKLAKEKQK